MQPFLNATWSIPDWIFAGLIPGLFIILFWMLKLWVQRLLARIDLIEERLRLNETLYHEIKAQQVMDQYSQEAAGGATGEPKLQEPRGRISFDEPSSGGADAEPDNA